MGYLGQWLSATKKKPDQHDIKYEEDDIENAIVTLSHVITTGIVVTELTGRHWQAHKTMVQSSDQQCHMALELANHSP